MILKKKLLIFFITIVGILLIFCFLVFQEKDIINIKTSREERVDAGMVIAFGKKIERPYFVILDNDKILINNIIFSPREKDPNMEKKEIIVTEMDIKKHELIHNCEDDYIKYSNLEGEQKVRERILNKYNNNPIVSKLEFKDDLLIIEFNDGDEINIMLSSFMQENVRESISKKEEKLQREQEVERIKSFLEEGTMIVFGYEYTIYIPSIKRQEIENVINKIKNGELSEINGKKEINNIVRKLEFAEDILKNINLWN